MSQRLLDRLLDGLTKRRMAQYNKHHEPEERKDYGFFRERVVIEINSMSNMELLDMVSDWIRER